MRPVRRDNSPQAGDFNPYSDAQHYLISRLGRYCSYCERPISTNLAVEHVQAKGLPAYVALEGTWINYLLACVNCNSTKKDKDVILSNYLLPDRDNTAYAFEYPQDGKVQPSVAAIALGLQKMADDTLALTGLDKAINEVFDENGKLVAVDRVGQRLEAWGIASDSHADLVAEPHSVGLRRSIVRTATTTGFFSIWMEAFSNDIDMRNRFIDAFNGTRQSGCFDLVTTLPVTPCPNHDALTDGGKV
jgi:hypothetical protein